MSYDIYLIKRALDRKAMLVSIISNAVAGSAHGAIAGGVNSVSHRENPITGAFRGAIGGAVGGGALGTLGNKYLGNAGTSGGQLLGGAVGGAIGSRLGHNRKFYEI